MAEIGIRFLAAALLAGLIVGSGLVIVFVIYAVWRGMTDD